MRNIALVTGASSGMGKEFVREISKKYKGLDEIWVVARRRERLRELKKEIIGTRVRILPLDLMEEESFERLKMVLAKEQPVVRILLMVLKLPELCLFYISLLLNNLLLTKCFPAMKSVFLSGVPGDTASADLR